MCRFSESNKDKLGNTLKFYNFTERHNKHRALFWYMLVAMMYPIFFAYNYSIFHYAAAISLFVAINFILTILVTFIPNKVIRHFFTSLLLLLIVVNSFTKLIGITLVHGNINKDIIAAIFATNANEASEMMGMLMTPQSMCILLGYPLVLILGTWLCCKFWKILPSIFNRYGATVFALCVCIIASYSTSPYKDGAIENETPAYLVQLAQSAHDAIQSNVPIKQTNPSISVRKEGQPPLIILIFGESTARYHSSLYGYDKPTNPLLQKKFEEGNIFRYENITSAWTHTLESFKLMMSTYSKSSPESVKWNECDNIIDISHKAGYYTTWLSNQSKKGLFDNLIGQYSDLCDTSIFLGNKYAGSQRYTLDGDLIPLVKEAIEKPAKKKLCIVHLMGCHVEFQRRYPERFGRFKPSDYTTLPAAHRMNIATYDNAMLYNDYVVSSIIDLTSRKDAVVIYSPDHGLDLYKSRPDYCDHALDSDTLSVRKSREIPFVIYPSPLYRQLRPEMTKRMAESVKNSFDTENLIYLVMDLMQCTFTTPIVKQKSLFNPNN